MKEYATLVTDDIASPYSYPIFSKQQSVNTPFGESMLTQMCGDGWEVIDACALPKLSTHDERPRFAFILERTADTAAKQELSRGDSEDDKKGHP